MMKKRLIKKKIKSMTDNEICEHLAYGSGYWSHFAELEFDKRLELNNGEFSLKGWEDILGY
jgi:hypothetical protein